jgi:hypothetical protein
MSDTTAAIIILPVLAALVIALECSRVGCTRFSRFLRDSRAEKKAVLLRSQA